MQEEDNEIQVTKSVIKPNDKASDEDAFNIILPSQEEVSEIEFIMSSLKVIDSMALLFLDLKKPDKIALMELESTLTDLIFFTTQTDELDPLTCEGLPIRRR